MKKYLRYGDDFIIVGKDKQQLVAWQEKTSIFLTERLKLQLNPKNNLMIKAKHGLKFLGVIIYPWGRKINNRNYQRINERLNQRNAASYSGLIVEHGNSKSIKEFHWRIFEKLI